MEISLRDDDINYFTSVEELKTVYDPIWKQVPVGLAVVPFQTGCQSGAIPESKKGTNQTYPVRENKELVEFLKRQIDLGNVRILQHGYSHEDFDGGWEFEACPNPQERVEEGRKALESTFETEITTFVPPHNSLSRRCAKAVIGEGLNILTAFGHWPWERPLSVSNLLNFLRLSGFRVRYGKQRRYRNSLDFKSHSEHPSYNLTRKTQTDQIDAGLRFTKQHEGSACIAYHYWELLEFDLLDEFHDLIQRWFGKNGVEFVTDEVILG